MITVMLLFKIFLIVFCFFGHTICEESACGNWVAYRDAKCIKVFDTLSSYKDADGYCHQQASGSSGSGLVTIRYEDEYQFVLNMLKSANVANDVWIGMKYENNAYRFSDGLEILFSNWAQGSPKNKSDYCVQLSSDETTFGKWSDVLCTKNNLIVCEKPQVWSLAYMQNVIQNTIQNPFPVGFIYVQLPNKSSPRDIWPHMVWSDVSYAYAGIFFRVSGGASAEFGQIQEGIAPRVTNFSSGWSNADHLNIALSGVCSSGECKETLVEGEWTPWAFGGAWGGSIYRLIRFFTSDVEVRPRNMAVRVWERVR